MKRAARRLVQALAAACVLVSAAGAREATVQDEQLLEVGFFGATKALLMAPEQPKVLEGVPVWAVGTSAGTISVAGLVASAPQLIDGAIFTSSVTRPQGAPGVWSDGHPRGVASMAVGKFSKPVLVVSHKEDRCPSTPAADADMLAAAFTASPRRQAVVVDALSNPNGDPCGPFSPHGFDEMDRDVVNLLVEFVLRAP